MIGSYLLLQLSILSLFLYFASVLFVNLGILPKTYHQKFWNTILATTFLVTALLGLLLAIQVNYKLDIPYIKSILKWHVNFGIAMSVVGIMHFFKHWNYYRDIFTRYHNYSSDNQSTEVKLDEYFTGNKIIYTSLLLGFTTIVFQVIILREMINILSGNEFITGFVLATWLGLTGIGALIPIKLPRNTSLFQYFQRSMIWLGVLPVAITVLLYFSKWLFFPPGVLVDIRYTFLIILILLTPYCIISGHLFSALVFLYKKQIQPYKTDILYSFETIGSLIGGILVSFIFLYWFTSLRTLAILLIVQLLFAYYHYSKKNIQQLPGFIVGVILAIILIVLPGDVWLKSLIFPGQKIVNNVETPYGNLVITQQQDQLNVFANHNLVFASDNIIGNEEKVHYALLQHASPVRVLLISGGNICLAKEILKYPQVKHVDIVEENRWLQKNIGLCDSVLKNSKVNIWYKDIIKTVKKIRGIYDVIIIDANAPSSLLQNRLYTVEFFRLLKKHCNEASVVSISLPSVGNYASQDRIGLHRLIFNSFKAVFKNVIVIPGERDYFLASQSDLSPEITRLPGLKKVINTYVNQYYIDDFSVSLRSKQLLEQLEGEQLLNHDFEPRAVYLGNNLYLDKFSAGWVILFIPLLLLLFPLIRMDRFDLSMYTVGFSISSFEVVLIFTFQIIFGFVYAASGIIIAICMGGLAVGAIINNKVRSYVNYKHISLIQLLLGIIILLFFFVNIMVIDSLSTPIGYLVIFFATFIPSLLAGMQFSNLVLYKSINGYPMSGKIYAIDLFGSAFGAILTSDLLIPAIGFIYTGCIIFLLNCLVALFLLIPKRY